MLFSNFLLFFVILARCYSAKQPNIILFLTDDQDDVLGGMKPMKFVNHLLTANGVTFTNSYTVSPICCPSRASILTGLYPHNHHTRKNTVAGGCYGKVWKDLENYTFATYLEQAGYKTFYAGKYLNQYGKKLQGGPETVPPGWTEWHGLVGNSVYYNYTISNNGVPTYSTDLYLTDVIRDLALNFIENQMDYEPFLMVLAPPAPHQPFTPAPRHMGRYANVTAVRYPNFNMAVEDKHWLMRMPPSPLPDSTIPELDRAFRDRWEALLAVDEMIADVVMTLENGGFMDNTYLIYTSDNGYHVGQFAQVYDKRQPYESDIKVPLIVSGPLIPKNVASSYPALNIDLAPTILSLAGLQPPSSMDGRPLRFDSVDHVERKMLISYRGEGGIGTVDRSCPWMYDGEHLSECYPLYDCKCQDSVNNTYACVRHIAKNVNYKYCRFEDDQEFVEIYDLDEDPFELQNIENSTFPIVRAWYNYVLDELLTCIGDHCSV